MRNGRYAMLVISDFIRSLQPNVGCEDFCRLVTYKIQAVYAENNIDVERLREHPEERLTASCVVYSDRRKEVWMVGDCQCMINGRLFTNGKPSEQAAATRRAEYIRRKLKNGFETTDFQVNDEGRRLILPDILASCKRQNIDFAVIDGFPIPIDKVRVLSAEGEVVLATDGYPFLRPTLVDSEEALARQLRDDPLCINTFKATKGLMRGNVSFDDRAYIRFTTL